MTHPLWINWLQSFCERSKRNYTE